MLGSLDQTKPDFILNKLMVMMMINNDADDNCFRKKICCSVERPIMYAETRSTKKRIL